MKDELAHERIDIIEQKMEAHRLEHVDFRRELHENTRSTKAIEKNTEELVYLFKGAKAARTFLLWTSPIVAAIGTGWALFHWLFTRGH